MIQALYSEQIEEQEQATQKFRKLLSRGNPYRDQAFLTPAQNSKKFHDRF